MRRFLESTRPPLDLEGLAGGQAISTPPYTPLDSWSTSYLLPSQELHYFGLFWQSHYFSFPILSEGRFGRDYQDLLAQTVPGQPRPASPLVDIVVALCVQIASFTLAPAAGSKAPGPPWGDDDNARPEHSHPSLAGFQYYRRCQEALEGAMESPSLTAVQCYIFSIVYLYEAGLVNTAQAMTSKAIMTAIILGLHTEPPPQLPAPEKERARRTWWSLQALDAHLAAEAGRPPLMTTAALSTCHRPTDTLEYALWLAPHYHHDESCPPWLGFQTQTLRLLETV